MTLIYYPRALIAKFFHTVTKVVSVSRVAVDSESKIRTTIGTTFFSILFLFTLSVRVLHYSFSNIFLPRNIFLTFCFLTLFHALDSGHIANIFFVKQEQILDNQCL